MYVSVYKPKELCFLSRFRPFLRPGEASKSLLPSEHTEETAETEGNWLVCERTHRAQDVGRTTGPEESDVPREEEEENGERTKKRKRERKDRPGSEQTAKRKKRKRRGKNQKKIREEVD